MEKNPFEIKFHNQFTSLVENLLKILRRDRNLTRQIKEYYLDYKKGDRFNFIHQTVETLEPHMDAVRQHDESIFICDGELYLLPKLDFKIFWGSEHLESDHKDVIWRFLTNLYVLGCHYIQKNDSYFHDMLKGLKIHQMLEQQVKQEEQDEENKGKESEQLGRELQRLFKGLFSENSFVFEIFNIEEVQEVVHSFKTNALETVKKFMANKGEAVSELVESIANKIKTKIVSGELDRSKIDQDIEKITRIVERLKRDLPKDPRFKGMFDMIKKNFNLDLTETFENPETAMKQFTEKFQETTGLDLNELQKETLDEEGESGESRPSWNKLEEILKASAEKAKETMAEQEENCDAEDTTNENVNLGGLLAAMNEIVEATSAEPVIEDTQLTVQPVKDGGEEPLVDLLPELGTDSLPQLE